MKLILLFAFLGLTLASQNYGGSSHGNRGHQGGGYGKHVGYQRSEKHHSVSYGSGSGSKQAYHGHYGGKCDHDGFYYNNAGSFIICSNSNAYVQPCAPGTRNSGAGNYQNGHSYYYRDFCDVNLVDYGYGVRHGGYGHGNSHGSHGGSHGGYGGSHGGFGGSHGGFGGSHGGFGGSHGGFGGSHGGFGQGYGGNSHGGYGPPHGGHSHGRGH